LFIHIGNLKLVALVDTRSTSSFIDPAVIAKSSIQVTNHDPLKVTMANGNILWTQALTTNYLYTIQGHEFSSDFRILELQGYDIILGCDWLYDYSPVGLNLKTREFTIEKQGNEVKFVDETLPNKHFLITHKKMQKLLRKGAVGAVLYMHELPLLEEVPILLAIAHVLAKHKQVFQEPTELPPARSIDHKIPLQSGADIVNIMPYRLSHKQKNTMEELVMNLLKNHVIRPNESPYSSPAILVKKKDGTWRLCIDYSKLNKVTIKNKYPILVIEDLLDELNGATIFSKLDLRSRYHQIRMHTDDIVKTAFSTHQGHYEYVVMPFGLTNATATFQTLMNQLLQQYLRKFVLVFFHDILIYSKNEAEHAKHLNTILSLLQKDSLYAKRSKCVFAQDKVEYLGHIISSAGVSTDPTKINAVQAWSIPQNITDLRGFLGLTGYYRRFIKDYGKIYRPLFDSLKKGDFS
jgi:hypothetical protein